MDGSDNIDDNMNELSATIDHHHHHQQQQTSKSCKCCPYGFHIDTDFVRYCNALLLTLYGQNNDINSQDNHVNESINNSDCLLNDNYIQHNDNHRSIEAIKVESNATTMSSPLNILNNRNDSNIGNDDDDQQQQSKLICDHQFDCKSIVHEYLDDKIEPSKTSVSKEIASIDTAIEHYQQQHQQPDDLTDYENLLQHNQRRKTSESSCCSSSESSSSAAISRIVLTQIRNDLAKSLSRVEHLEQQVEQMTQLKQRLIELELENSKLIDELKNKNQSSINNVNYDDVAKGIENLSLIKYETINVEPTIKHNIGTLTNFAPCVLYRNVFVQTDLKHSDIRTNNVKTIDSSTSMMMPMMTMTSNSSFENDRKSSKDNAIKAFTVKDGCNNQINNDSNNNNNNNDKDDNTNKMINDHNFQIRKMIYSHIDNNENIDSTIDAKEDKDYGSTADNDDNNNTNTVLSIIDESSIENVRHNCDNNNNNNRNISSTSPILNNIIVDDDNFNSQPSNDLIIKDLFLSECLTNQHLIVRRRRRLCDKCKLNETTNNTDNSNSLVCSTISTTSSSPSSSSSPPLSSPTSSSMAASSTVESSSISTFNQKMINYENRMLKSDSGISVDPKMSIKSNNNISTSSSIIMKNYKQSPQSCIDDIEDVDDDDDDDMIRMISSSTEFESIPLSNESESDFSTLSNRTTNSNGDQFKNEQPKQQLSSNGLNYQQQQKDNRKLFIITNELKAALKIINDNLFSSPKCPLLLSKSMAVVGKNWFRISSSVDSNYNAVESYIDFIEKYYSKQLLEWLVNLTDPSGNTALHYAISYNNFDIVSILLDSKVCDVDQFNKNGYTATMLVSLVKVDNEIQREIVERLFTIADINRKAKQNGQTALMLAASHGRVEITKILLECGAEINLQDNDGSTALMCAAEHGHTEIIALLLSHSECDPLIEDNEGSTALKIALINGHNDIGVMLYAGSSSHLKRINNNNNNNRSLSLSHQQLVSSLLSSSNSNSNDSSSSPTSSTFSYHYRQSS